MRFLSLHFPTIETPPLLYRKSIWNTVARLTLFIIEALKSIRGRRIRVISLEECISSVVQVYMHVSNLKCFTRRVYFRYFVDRNLFLHLNFKAVFFIFYYENFKAVWIVQLTVNIFQSVENTFLLSLQLQSEWVFYSLRCTQIFVKSFHKCVRLFFEFVQYDPNKLIVRISKGIRFLSFKYLKFDRCTWSFVFGRGFYLRE